MGGNVWEWTDTSAGNGEYQTLYFHVYGGAWDSVKKQEDLFFNYNGGNDDLRSDHVATNHCDEKKNNRGFRVAAPALEVAPFPQISDSF